MMTRVPIGHELFDSEGEKIGTIDDVYSDPVTLEPRWLAVKTGRWGRHSVVPIAQVHFEDNRARMPAPKDVVLNAPAIAGPGGPSTDEERQLCEHYSWWPEQDAATPDAEPATSRGPSRKLERPHEPQPESR